MSENEPPNESSEIELQVRRWTLRLSEDRHEIILRMSGDGGTIDVPIKVEEVGKLISGLEVAVRMAQDEASQG
jgi:hypothetical protein